MDLHVLPSNLKHVTIALMVNTIRIDALCSS
jgi:hypothetical protein